MRLRINPFNVLIITGVVLNIALFSLWVYQFDIGRADPLEMYSERTEADLNSGLSHLLNCSYFRRTYPKYVSPIYHTHSVLFSYNRILGKLGFWAVARPEHHLIELSRDFFEIQTPIKRQAILAHEMLHIVGMPPHKLSLDFAHDAIYVTETQCFGNTDDLP